MPETRLLVAAFNRANEQLLAGGSVLAFRDVPQEAAHLALKEIHVRRIKRVIQALNSRALALRAFGSGGHEDR